MTNGGDAIFFEEHYRHSNGTFVHGDDDKHQVRDDVYDGGTGVLTAMTLNYYAKHSLYVTEVGPDEEYLFVFSQA